MSACDGYGEGRALAMLNGTVHILAGKVPRVAETVNGDIHVDDNAAVSIANTLNGAIRLGSHASAQSLHTVNGDQTIGPFAHIAQSIESVNGNIVLERGAEVLGGISSVNGNVELIAAHVAGGINIGGRNPQDSPSHGSPPRIVIGAGSRVEGGLQADRDVTLYVNDNARIDAVRGAVPIAFTGDTPPGP